MPSPGGQAWWAGAGQCPGRWLLSLSFSVWTRTSEWRVLFSVPDPRVPLVTVDCGEPQDPHHCHGLCPLPQSPSPLGHRHGSRSWRGWGQGQVQGCRREGGAACGWIHLAPSPTLTCVGLLRGSQAGGAQAQSEERCWAPGADCSFLGLILQTTPIRSQHRASSVPGLV